MKIKSIISLLCLSVGTFLFHACEDVPAPYDIPNQGDANSIYGNGSKESPYTVKGASLNQHGGYAWVKAYIVGYIPTGDNISSTISDIVFSTEGAGTTNIVVATTPDNKDVNNCMAVQLPSGDVRNALNLQAHPENIGKEVMLYGTMERYFGASGVKNVTAAILDGQNIGEVPAEGPGEGIFSATFAEDLCGFTINNVNLPVEMGSEVWTIDSHKYAKATSYLNGTNYAAESWLVSPAIDLTQVSAATLTFDYCARYFNDLENNITVRVTDAANENWQLLPVEIKDCSDWNFVASKDIDLNAYKGKNIKIAFVYNCTDKAGTFELKNVLIEDRTAQEEQPITGENLLKNGGFETWENGIALDWKSNNSAGNATVTQSNDAHTGNYSAMIEGSTEANKRLGSTEMTLKAGTYAIKAYFKAVDANASIRLGYAINEADGSIAGGNSYKYGGYVNDITKNEWVEATHEFTLEANTTINLVVMVGKNPGQSVLIDDFSLLTNNGGIIEGEEPEQPEQPGDAILSESFASGIGTFTAVNVSGAQVWNADTQYKCMKMSAYKDGSSVANEDWLISPAINLNKTSTLTFEQAFGPYNKSMDNANKLYTVWVSNNYSGDVTAATWTQVTINYPAESGWAFSNAQAALPAMGTQAHVAFKYKNADGDETLTWEIKNVVIK